MKNILSFFAVLLLWPAVLYAGPVDLSGVWQLSKADDAGFGTVPVLVPGDVHSALLEAGIIEDPYYSCNEIKSLWVGREDWIYRRSFILDASFLGHEAIYLRAEDVDTFCDISINGHKIGTSTNRFRRWEWDITPFLREGENVIEGYFHSAEKKSEEISREIPYPVPLAENLGRVPHINLIRKPTCHGGWDWGPCQMVTGFAGKVMLIPADVARIDYVMCDQDFSVEGRCTVTVNVEVTSPKGGKTVLKVDLGGRRKTRQVDIVPGRNVLSLPVTVKDPELWWPNGMGSQNLYDLTVSVGESTVKKKIGLRKIEVVNRPDTVYGKPGLSMTFRVNGKDVYVKGANWIPCDLFETRQTYARYSDILESAKDAHMNMVRVWGGGQFEHDAFYEICDSLGIMIWHDFMFSCSTYPGTDGFLSEVEAELNHQLRRLRDHCSIAMWCGDNECVGALGWFECTRQNPGFYTANYDRLVRLRNDVVKAVDPQRVYWPSSPCAGFGDYTTDNWKEDTKGDMHLWSVSKNAEKLDRYYDVKPRFCSEYGHSSFSGYELAGKYCQEGQLNPWSPDFEHHQKEFNGNKVIFDRLYLHFRFPDGVKNLLYLSQVEQAMGLKTASEFWRTLEPNCMGSIIWQLNDIWPGSSWSSIEYGGKWKQSHYHIRRFYAPELISAVPSFDNRDSLDIWVINDTPEHSGCTATVTLRDFSGNILKRLSLDADVPGNTSERIISFRLEDFGPRQERINTFLSMELVRAGEVVAYNDYMFSEFKEAPLQEAQVSVSVHDENGEWVVRLSADKPAFYVWLDAPGIPGEFSDNSFTLYPGIPAEVRFVCKDRTVGLKDFEAALEVMHLRQTY